MNAMLNKVYYLQQIKYLDTVVVVMRCNSDHVRNSQNNH